MTATREAAADFTLSEHGRPALSQPALREVQHFRDFQFAGYRRADGLFDIEGRMTDRKPYEFPNEWRGTVPVDDPLHDMRIRLTLDEHFLIHDVEVVTSASPYDICGAITPRWIGGTSVVSSRKSSRSNGSRLATALPIASSPAATRSQTSWFCGSWPGA